MRYKINQTGPNNQFGGAKTGLLRVKYQVFMADMVNIEPINPTNSGSNNEKANLTV